MEKIKRVWLLLYGGLRYDPQALCLFLLHLIIPTKAQSVNEMSEDKILKALADGRSFIRLGDGESLIMTGRDIYFQSTSHELANRLRTIAQDYSNHSPYILGVPTTKLSTRESDLPLRERRIWRLYRVLFPLYFPTTASFPSAVYFYVQGRFKEKIAPLFKNHNVIFVSKASVFDDSFTAYAETTFKSAHYVLVPSHNALSVETKARKEIDVILKSLAGQPVVIIFSAGPAGKVWAYDYTMRGVQCLDIGFGMELIAHDTDRSHKM